MSRARVIVVGAGIGGLVAAAETAAAGLDVTVLERSGAVGGKLRTASIDGRAIDVGPTVLTMRWVFDELFADLGASFEEAVPLRAAGVIARHFFADRSTLDLVASLPESIERIRAFAGDREADGYARFCDHARGIFEVVDPFFLRAPRPTLLGAARAARTLGLGSLVAVDGYRTMHRALRGFFRDPRLLQLFGRYATYVGSSPYLAPATLNVIAHVEREGVSLPEGGIVAIARALEGLAARNGARIRRGAHVTSIDAAGGRVRGVTLSDGERLEADGVVFNGDAEALARGLLGREASRHQAIHERSLSALTFAMLADVRGRELSRHNVFFSADEEAEFDELFEARRLPRSPSLYVCAQDRGEGASPAPGPGERIFCVVNAPATGDVRELSPEEIEACRQSLSSAMERAGVTITTAHPVLTTTPAEFARRFPGTGGALYGPVSHGMRSPFARTAARSAVRGLYLAGGSAHPGAGVPMAALSGRLAARALLEDRPSTRSSPRAAMPGGTSMS